MIWITFSVLSAILSQSFVSGQGPIWANWGQWEKCSKPCGYGTQSRRRECAAWTNQRCLQRASQSCNNFPCTDHQGGGGGGGGQLSTNWGPWQQWSRCSKSCGRGEQRRTRHCTGGRQCQETKIQGCNYHQCQRDRGGGGGGWTDWSKCSASCEGGTQTRTFHGTFETRSETRSCNIQWCDIGEPFDSTWNEWSRWSKCSNNCGTGTKSRTRKCNSNTITLRSLGLCAGPAKEDKICSDTSECDPKWAAWSSWGRCSKTCGGGTSKRSRACLHGTKNQCKGSSSGQRRCSIRNCPAEWSKWSKWSKCSKTCGVGVMRQTRTCGKGAKTCAGSSIRRKSCKLRNCTKVTRMQSANPNSTTEQQLNGLTYRRSHFVDDINDNKSGSKYCNFNTKIQKRPQKKPKPVNRIMLPAQSQWRKWGNWVPCSETCGQGARLRVRRCKSGRRCKGSNIEISRCQIKECHREPEWGSWSTWSKCTLTCDGGSRSRKRECQGNGEDCKGKDSQSEACGTIECKKEPNWEAWSKWSRCTKTCGGGVKIRGRICENRATGCKGTNVMTTDCNTGACEKEWNVWGSWSKCSATCGKANRRRVRSCKSQGCMGPTTSTEDCKFVACPKKPNWEAWSKWSRCTKTCGGGVKIRGRICENRATGCKGTSVMTTDCNTGACEKEPNWEAWSKWSRCTKTCGGGVKIRGRICENRATGCKGTSVMTTDCNTGACEKEPNWEAWSKWSRCTKTCGGGVKIRGRICENRATGCKGTSVMTTDCNTGACEKEPNWEAWSKWSQCTETCGGGVKIRRRICEKRATGCKGTNAMTADCNTGACEKEWNAWGSWSKCSATCGKANRRRVRSCKSQGCKGPKTSTEDCKFVTCPKKWNAWGSWSKCSATCGKANRRRVRSCKSQGCKGPKTSTEDCKFVTCPKKCSKIQPMKNGKIVGKKDEYRSGNSISFECNTGHQLVGASTIKCKNNGDWTSKAPRCVVEWSEWKKWSECTLTCGKGSQIRKRSCNVEKCDGNGSEVRSCNSNSCPAIWSEWVAWSDCTVECGGGARVRNRVCTTESENKCPGKDRETEDCNEKACPLKGRRCKEISRPLNGQVKVITKGSNRVGTILSFKCLPAFIASGYSKIICKSDGQWSREAPFCTAKICKRAVEPPKFCAKSCVNSGDCVGISKYCLCDGACARECPKLESPEHGHVELDGLKYGYTANYICDPGFILIGANSTICQSNGMWSESMPECQLASTCGKAGDIGGLFSAAGGRIVGGSKARKGAWPWQGLVIAKASGGSVEKSFNSLRGGFSIINHRWVLTAAHIYDNILPKYKKSLRYVVGITNKPEKGKFSEYAQIFQASEEIVHPQYDQDNFYDFDIALIKTGKKFIVRDGVFVKTDVTLEIQYNRDVRPICLPCWTKYGKNVAVSSSEQAARFGGTACLKVPPKDLNKPGNVVVTGFGRTEVNKRELPLALKQALLHIQNDTVCDDGTEKIREDPHFSKANYTSRMMCTRSGSPHKLMDACSGDSGGPLARLIVNADGSSQWVQVGIVSWGYGCAYVADGYEYPGYFTRLTAMMDFIAEKVTVL